MKKFFLFLLGALILTGCTTTKSIPTQTASTIYKVGDIYNQNGLIGIVVKVDETGMHGIIMSLQGSKDKWTANKKFNFETNAFYEDDGQKNMEVIAKYVESGKATWADFPLMNWARSLGNGWYIPSKDEAMEIWRNMSGGADGYKWSQSRFIKNDFQKFDKAQRKFGGEKLVDNGYFGTKQPFIWYTSTEGDGGFAYAIQFDNTSVKTGLTMGFGTTKYATYLCDKRPLSMSMFRSRAIHKF